MKSRNYLTLSDCVTMWDELSLDTDVIVEVIKEDDSRATWYIPVRECIEGELADYKVVGWGRAPAGDFYVRCWE